MWNRVKGLAKTHAGHTKSTFHNFKQNVTQLARAEILLTNPCGLSLINLCISKMKDYGYPLQWIVITCIKKLTSITWFITFTLSKQQCNRPSNDCFQAVCGKTEDTHGRSLF